jgi:hypothetical protein
MVNKEIELFYKKHNLSLNQVVDYHFPGKKALPSGTQPQRVRRTLAGNVLWLSG